MRLMRVILPWADSPATMTTDARAPARPGLGSPSKATLWLLLVSLPLPLVLLLLLLLPLPLLLLLRLLLLTILLSLLLLALALALALAWPVLFSLLRPRLLLPGQLLLPPVLEEVERDRMAGQVERVHGVLPPSRNGMSCLRRTADAAVAAAVAVTVAVAVASAGWGTRGAPSPLALAWESPGRACTWEDGEEVRGWLAGLMPRFSALLHTAPLPPPPPPSTCQHHGSKQAAGMAIPPMRQPQQPCNCAHLRSGRNDPGVLLRVAGCRGC